ncbi:MAG: hypothetical protein J0H71_02000 [Rhizobiales bacterium]|nr:hypothetical protein [Hyphomicrobiales bacterium]
MPYILLIAVIGVLLLYVSGAIPLSSVGGPMVIALAFFAAALAVAIHEAWTKRRGVLGWIVNIVSSFFGTFVAAQLGGLMMVILLSPFVSGPSLAASGGAVMAASLVGTMAASVLGSWGTLAIVNRWR